MSLTFHTPSDHQNPLVFFPKSAHVLYRTSPEARVYRMGYVRDAKTWAPLIKIQIRSHHQNRPRLLFKMCGLDLQSIAHLGPTIPKKIWKKNPFLSQGRQPSFGLLDGGSNGAAHLTWIHIPNVTSPCPARWTDQIWDQIVQWVPPSPDPQTGFVSFSTQLTPPRL